MSQPIFHPNWCDLTLCSVTRPGRGAHRSYRQVVEARDRDQYELMASLSEPAQPIPVLPDDWSSIHLLAYRADDRRPDRQPSRVLILPLRQAFLLARAVDRLLLAVWFPEDSRPAALGAFSDLDFPEGGTPR